VYQNFGFYRYSRWGELSPCTLQGFYFIIIAYLKPGGQKINFEGVGNDDETRRDLQRYDDAL
jgi:hypothetical protein